MVRERRVVDPTVARVLPMPVGPACSEREECDLPLPFLGLARHADQLKAVDDRPNGIVLLCQPETGDSPPFAAPFVGGAALC